MYSVKKKYVNGIAITAEMKSIIIKLLDKIMIRFCSVAPSTFLMLTSLILVSVVKTAIPNNPIVDIVIANIARKVNILNITL